MKKKKKKGKHSKKVKKEKKKKSKKQKCEKNESSDSSSVSALKPTRDAAWECCVQRSDIWGPKIYVRTWGMLLVKIDSQENAWESSTWKCTGNGRNMDLRLEIRAGGWRYGWRITAV